MQGRSLASLVGAAALSIGGATAAFAETAAEIAENAAKKFAGETVTIVKIPGPMALEVTEFTGPLFEERTGVKVAVIEVPLAELFSKIMLEYRGGGSEYDVLDVQAAKIPDLASSGAIVPLDDWMTQYEYWDDYQDVAPAWRDAWGRFGGKQYGFVDDGDVFIMFYRKDLFDDATHQAAFKAEYGYDLAPPKTYKAFHETTCFFTAAVEGLYGAANPRQRGTMFYWYEEEFRNKGGKWFDIDSMEATVNSDIGVAVLERMIAENKCMPPGIETWGVIESMNAWLAGDLAMITWWPGLGRWGEGYGTDIDAMSWVPKSQIVGKAGYATVPGGRPQLAAGNLFTVSGNSKKQDLAYLFAQWQNSSDISAQRVQLPYSFRDPFRMSHFASADFRGLWPAAGAYLDALEASSQTGLIDLTIIQTDTYNGLLDAGLEKAFAGASSAQDALDDVAAAWDDLTEEIGADDQREAYESWLSAPNAYPDEITE